jgi:hypothetical protein
MLGTQLVDGFLDDFQATLFSHLFCGKVSVHTGACKAREWGRSKEMTVE